MQIDICDVLKMLEQAKDDCLLEVDEKHLTADALEKCVNHGVRKMYYKIMLAFLDFDRKRQAG